MPINLLDYFFSPTQPIAIVINVIISAITLLGLWYVGRDFIQLRAEKAHLDELNLEAEVDRLEKTAESFDEHSPVRQRINDLQYLKSKGHDLELESLAAQAAGQLDDRLGFTRWATGSVVLLGLGGTVLGLGISTDRATVIIRDSNAMNLETAIQQTIATFSGLGLAFSTTMFGVSAAIILSALVSWRRHSQSDFLRGLEHATAVYLAPKYRTSVSQSLADAARNLTAIEAELRGSLDSVVSSLRDSLGDITDQIRTRGQSLTDSVDKLHEDLETKSNKILTKHDESLQTLHQIAGNYTDGPSLSDLIQHIQEGIASVKSASEEMRDVLPEISENINQQIDRQTTDLHEALTAYTDRIAGSVEEQKDIVSDGFQRYVDAIPTIRSGVLDSIQAQGEALAASIDRIVDSVEQQKKTVSDGFQQYADAIPTIRSGVLDSIQAQGKALRQLLEEYQQRLEALETGHANTLGEQSREAKDQFAAMNSQLERLDRSISDLHKAATELSEAARQEFRPPPESGGSPPPSAPPGGHTPPPPGPAGVPGRPPSPRPRGTFGGEQAFEDEAPIEDVDASPPPKKMSIFSRFFGR